MNSSIRVIIGRAEVETTKNATLSKIPAVTLTFWIIKIAATTLGETAGDAVSKSTLGTALGDWTADTAGLGYRGGTVVFVGLLALVAAAYYWTKVSRTVLFWAAFILTRPLGAVVGDFLDKPLKSGGLALSRYSASFALVVFIAVCVMIFPQRAASQNH